MKLSRLSVVVSVLVAFNLAIAYPVLDLLGNNAEFFVAHDASRTGIVIIAVLLTVAVPGLLITGVLLVERVNAKLGSIVYWVGTGVLLAALAIQVLKRTPLDAAVSPWVLVAVALGLGELGSRLWFHYAKDDSGLIIRMGFAVPLLVLVLFGMTDVQAILLPAGEASDQPPVAVGNPTPVVFVIFDELPVVSLLDENLVIDDAMFPDFASFSSEGTWYRNATSVESHTRFAVPAILTGRDPSHDTLPTNADHPHNIFSILGDSYRVEALEPMTALCPQSVCAADSEIGLSKLIRAIASDIAVVIAHLLSPTAWTESLPAIDEGWANFSETPESESVSWDPETRKGDLVGQFRMWLDDLPATESDNVLFFAHSLLAHRPWRYLPSGQEYRDVIFANLGKKGWGDDRWLMAQAYQRHLLQVQAADTMLGELIDVLKSNGLYDSALVVVTADHGISMQMGTEPRAPRKRTLIDIAAVPLIVKYPHQEEGSVVDLPVQTLDVLPTIADVLELEPRPNVHGTSLLSDRGGLKPRVIDSGGGPLEIPANIADALFELVDAKSQLLGNAIASIYELAPPGTSQLLGKPVADMAIASESAPFSAEIREAEMFDEVDLGSSSIPALIAANLDTRFPVEEQAQIAVGVNGRIAAITRTMSRGTDQRNSELSAVVDPEFLRSGSNEITLYLVGEDPEGTLLTPLNIVDLDL